MGRWVRVRHLLPLHHPARAIPARVQNPDGIATCTTGLSSWGKLLVFCSTRAFVIPFSRSRLSRPSLGWCQKRAALQSWAWLAKPRTASTCALSSWPSLCAESADRHRNTQQIYMAELGSMPVKSAAAIPNVKLRVFALFLTATIWPGETTRCRKYFLNHLTKTGCMCVDIAGMEYWEDSIFHP